MILRSITLHGFGSYRKEQTFTFPTQCPGYFFITGDNQANPRLQSNGTGKSTLLAAVTWCFYGKSTRGIKGSRVVSWRGEHCTVAVAFERLGVAYVVKRTQSPNELTLSTKGHEFKVVSQDELTTVLGLNFECYTASALFGQSNKFFFDMGPTEKLNLLSFVLNLDEWIVRSDRAKEDAERLTLEGNAEENRRAEIGGRIEELAEQVKSLRKLNESYEDERHWRIKDVEKSLLQLTRTRRELVIQRDKVKAKLVDQDVIVQELSEKVRVLGANVNRDARERAARNESRYNADIRYLREELASLDSAYPNCPKCRQAVSKQHLREETALIKAKLAKAKTQRDVAVAQLELLRNEEDRRKEKRQNREVTLHKQQQAVKTLNNRLAELRQELNGNRLERDQLDRQIAEWKKEKNPHAKSYAEAVKFFQDLQTLKDDTSRHLLELRRQVTAAKYWVKGFRDVRLWLLDEVLRELELETNNALLSLGLENWTVAFAVERETKSGTLSRGLNVFVSSPDSEEPKLWDDWCGGETQRLRIAGSVAVCDLISRRRSLDLNWECYDEPTTSLSPQGIEDLLRFFEERAVLENKQIYLIDQHALGFGNFSGVYTVVKDEDGSRIEG